MVKQIHHVGINVSDLNRSMNFYKEHLGANFIRGMYNPTIGKLIIYMQIDNLLLELMSPQHPSPDDCHGIIHLAFQVSDHSWEADRISQMGYSFITKPRTAGSGSGRVCFFDVPGQISAEIIERSENLLEHWEPSHGITGIPFIILESDEYEKTCRFFLKPYA